MEDATYVISIDFNVISPYTKLSAYTCSLFYNVPSFTLSIIREKV